MAEGIKQLFHLEEAEEPCEPVSFSDDTNASVASYSSDLTDDAISSSLSPSTPSNSSSHSLEQDSSGPLYELSSLMAQLPLKRGLSKYFQGKSQSFTALSNVRYIEDLAKKETRFKRKIKPCKSYGQGLDSDLRYKPYYAPMASSRTISKKASRSLCSSLVARSSSSSFLLGEMLRTPSLAPSALAITPHSCGGELSWHKMRWPR